MTFTRGRVILGICVLLLLSFAGFHLWLRVQLRHRLDAVHRHCAPVTPEEIDAAVAKIPPDQNAATLYMQAVDAWREPAEQSLDQKTVDELGVLFGNEPVSEETAAIVRRYIELNALALDLAHRATGMPQWRYSSADQANEKRIMVLGRLAHLLALNAILLAGAKDSAGAVDMLTDTLAIGRSFQDDRVILAQITRTAVNANVFNSLPCVLSRTALTKQELLRLGTALSFAEIKEELGVAMMGERYLGLSRNATMMIPPASMENFAEVWYAVFRFSGLGIRDTLRCLDTTTRTAEALQEPFPTALDKALTAISAWQAAPFWLMPNTASLTRPCVSVVEDAAINAARVGIIRTALAVERYRLEKGTLPDKLEELIPQYVDTVPIDPLGKRSSPNTPLRYHKTQVGYVLYSVGLNRVDENGLRGETEREGDIVFEVQRAAN